MHQWGICLQCSIMPLKIVLPDTLMGELKKALILPVCLLNSC